MREVRLDTPTNDSGRIISLLVAELGAIYSNKQQYHRLGVFLHDFVPEDALQTDILGLVDTPATTGQSPAWQPLTPSTQVGKGKMRYAAEDLSNAWQPKRQIRSPRYVSDWDELPRARIV